MTAQTYRECSSAELLDQIGWRTGKRFEKGTTEDVYADQVGEVAYQASC